MRILGCDPGLATFGLALLDVKDGVAPSVVLADTLRTSPSPKKRRMGWVADQERRLASLIDRLSDIIRLPRVVAIETMPFVRSATSSAQIALAYGALYALARQRVVPVASYSPREVREALGLAPKASKMEVADAVLRRMDDPGCALLVVQDSEHVYDAAAVALAHAVFAPAR